MSYGTYAVYDSTTGRIDRLISCPEASVAPSCAAGEQALPISDETDATHYIDVATQALVPFPAQPSPDYVWDWTSKAWQGDLAAAKTRKSGLIEVERDRRIVAAVMVYDGANLDADARAKDNLMAKLAEVNSRIAVNDPLPPEQLVWRDADNQMHAFADMTSYKAWLDGFAIAMGSRGTDAYAWSWQKKAALDALTSQADVDAFDPTI